MNMSEVDENERFDHQPAPTVTDYDAQQKEDDKKYAVQVYLLKAIVLSIAVSRTDQKIILRPCLSVPCTRTSSIHCLTIGSSPRPKSIEGELGQKPSTARNHMTSDEASLSGTSPDGGKK